MVLIVMHICLIIFFMYACTAFYQSPLILTALLQIDLINVAISMHVFLSGHHDAALLNDDLNAIELTRASIMTSYSLV